MFDFTYCNSLVSYSRYLTRTVNIGHLPVGGHYPIRIQSMTNTNTLDTVSTVEQAIRMIQAGCEYVRITAPGIKEAENLLNIKNELKKRGYNTPLIADIHFNPKAAEVAARIVEKVRINPGNYIDKKIGKIDFTEAEYREDIDKIQKRLIPLINICKDHETALRIGSNHGSLSDRILSRYGNTPLGMVEAAMEFLRICKTLNFHNIVVSMKSSNIRIMVESTRLLINKMKAEGMNYPVHLGVTEAGEGEDGRIKSAAGIGALLEDGIGDTIRVSLTEPPENEIPVAKLLVERYYDRKNHPVIKPIDQSPINPFEYKRRETQSVENIGGSNTPILYSELQNKNNLKLIPVGINDLTSEFIKQIKNDKQVILIFETDNPHGLAEQRRMFFDLILHDCKTPVIIKRTYKNLNTETFQLHSAIDFGGLLIDGLGDGIWIEHDENFSEDFANLTGFGILQSTGVRITKTEYISCPTCGRTNYNIQDVLKKVKEKTSQFKKLKIGVMGCIVNGPGEMADADYGIVGSGKEKVILFKGNQIIKKNIPEENAADELIKLIKESGEQV